VFLIWLFMRAARRSVNPGNRGLSALILILLAAQYLLGVLDVVLLAPVWLQVVHLLGADVLWAALVVLAARLTLPPAESDLNN
jgi:cytochrome c oxidase assembly protein subunit 15